MNQLRAVAFISATVLTAFAQGGGGSISGRIANAATGAYLENAEVRIVGTDRVTTTVAGGRYVFTNVAAGELTLSAAYTGLDTQQQKISTTAGRAASLDFNLTSAQQYGGDTVQLGAFVVASVREGNAKAIVDQRQAANIKNVIAADAFGSVSEDNVGEFLKYMPGLMIDYVENDARTVRVRGLSSNLGIYFTGPPTTRSGTRHGRKARN